jgi:predicted amidohydrolase
MKISLIQSDIVWNCPVANREHCQELANDALASGGSVLVFPEMFTTGFSMPTGEIARESAQVGTSFLNVLAIDHKVFALGSLPEIANDGSLYNSAWIATPQGSVHTYRKIHLFSYGDETKLYAPGNDMCTFTARNPQGESLRCTVLICYDLRFAPLFLARAPQTDLFIVMANWPASRREHWLTLLRARAIETQSYVAGVNRVGSGGGLTYSGDSALFAPDGTELGRLADTVGVLTHDVTASNVASWRASFPALRDRKPAVYARLNEE